MATAIQNPKLRPPLTTPIPINTLQIPDEDAQRLRALVRASLSNLDRLSLDQIIHRAYRLGSERCHRAMAAKGQEDQPITLSEIERRAIEQAFASTRGDVLATAKLLGAGKTTVYRKLHGYGLLAPKYDYCPNCGCNLRIPLKLKL
jgi:DNA-binding NtrC family response regulator